MSDADLGRWILWLEQMRHVITSGDRHTMHADSDEQYRLFRDATAELRRAMDTIAAMAPPQALERAGGGPVNDTRQTRMAV